MTAPDAWHIPNIPQVNSENSMPMVKRKNTLSEREQQIFSLLGRGESNADIASAFSISVRTVETHYERIGSKLDLKGMRALRRHAIRTAQLSLLSAPETIIAPPP